MNALLFAAAWTLAAVTVLALARVFRGPTPFDRLTGLGLIGTTVVVALVAFGIHTGRAELYVDIALAYALISFIGVLAFGKYFERRRGEP